MTKIDNDPEDLRRSVADFLGMTDVQDTNLIDPEADLEAVRLEAERNGLLEDPANADVIARALTLIRAAAREEQTSQDALRPLLDLCREQPLPKSSPLLVEPDKQAMERLQHALGSIAQAIRRRRPIAVRQNAAGLFRLRRTRSSGPVTGSWDGMPADEMHMDFVGFLRHYLARTAQLDEKSSRIAAQVVADLAWKGTSCLPDFAFVESSPLEVVLAWKRTPAADAVSAPQVMSAAATASAVPTSDEHAEVRIRASLPEVADLLDQIRIDYATPALRPALPVAACKANFTAKWDRKRAAALVSALSDAADLPEQEVTETLKGVLMKQVFVCYQRNDESGALRCLGNVSHLMPVGS